MEYLSQFYDGWRDLMDNKSDPRTRDYPLMDSPFPTIAISLTYAYFVKVLGPKLMENRKPFELRKVLIVYNAAQVLFSMWLFYESCIGGWLNGYNLRCEPVDYSYSPRAIRTAWGCWWYYFSKFTEFFDTFFFVMRKRYDQVSTLHVIHHGIMPVSVWWGVKFTPGGHSTFFGFLNTFVHIFMYAYYMLAAMGPKVQRYLWWKKYLTVMQMIQFVLVMVHSFQLFFKNDCNYPIGFAYFIGAHAVMFYFLFSNFYKRAYVRRDGKDKSAVMANGHANGALKKDDDATQKQKGHFNSTVNRFQNTFNKFTTEMCNPALNSNTRQRILSNGNGIGNGGNK
ncbi:elongation of very long chain fatty acids protein AAEL008004 isoform X2 [Drosophila innubila]|uniref:elongation of very long chain fatty acids protein AAEL008004 isoform X2 n=1 Tax=Drosophila innubila TaxID=198719 RepID=UPI00148DFA3D|nr:elongation of very long chain fatty acids protein AAEL008004 isoform X2 [Drosophila innubila]